MEKKPTVINRGLDAQHINTGGSSSISEVEIELIKANPYQPRQLFAEDTLNELSDSIRRHGLISPVTLLKNDDGSYHIIAGERRFRAAKIAGLDSMPNQYPPPVCERKPRNRHLTGSEGSILMVPADWSNTLLRSII